ncbi:hypothetical protein PQV03_10090 [Thermoanaerobacterium thermosaccharolyticum]|jgi:phage baseplate assembly protein W|uniref:hypothetical protein n=1 Tax=Thermoanaerobacterium thermosaccharolyticum TaxID=1517 RepID=UPI003D2DCAE9
MLVTIDTSNISNINWSASGTDRVIQNVINIIKTFKYEVAYDRTMGLTGKFIDKPLDEAIAFATAELIEAITEREPRTTVKEANFTRLDEDGNMSFEVVVDVG